jgi:hypothetical protein
MLSSRLTGSCRASQPHYDQPISHGRVTYTSGVSSTDGQPMDWTVIGARGAAGVVVICGDVITGPRAPHRYTKRLDHVQVSC